MIDSNINVKTSLGNEVANVAIAYKNAEILNEKIRNSKEKDGLFSSLWNEVKVQSDIGISDKKCDEAIEAYKNGDITFEEADEKIKEYSIKQEESLNLFANITASVAALGVTAIAASLIAGGLATPLVLAAIGACSGAIVKSGFKFIDRATNNINDDAFDKKEIIKDCLSGAITGSVATITMGTASGASSFTNAVIGCGKTGIKTGAVASSGNYFINTAFDENKQFNAQELAKTTLEGTIIGGTVGAVMGGANSVLHNTGLLKSGCSFETFTKNAGKTTKNDVRANSICTAEYKILNDRISDAAA